MYIEQIQVKKTNRLASLYPMTKLWIVLIYSVMSGVIATIRIDGYAYMMFVWFLIVPLLSFCSGVTLARFWKAISKVLIVATMIIVLQMFLVQTAGEGRPIVELVRWHITDKPFVIAPTIYQYGLANGIELSMNVLNVAGIFVWLFQTTENKELSRALEKSGMHYKSTFVFISSLQMIEGLGKNSKTIMNAQRARGVETEGNVFVRMRAFFPSIVPLVLSAVTNTEERVLTLDLKDLTRPAKKHESLKLKRTDTNGLPWSQSLRCRSCSWFGRCCYGYGNRIRRCDVQLSADFAARH
jgi:energy-coupling factor transporter transmembrane protein EcfT